MLCKVDQFRASKGWCDKFFRRNNNTLNLLKEKAEKRAVDNPHLPVLHQKKEMLPKYIIKLVNREIEAFTAREAARKNGKKITEEISEIKIV